MNIQQAYLVVSAKIPSDDIKVKQRLDRGYDILQSYGYTIQLLDEEKQVYSVHRASTQLLEDNSITYEVSVSSCTCPDFDTARGNLCKHRLAIMMLVEMNKDGSQDNT